MRTRTQISTALVLVLLLCSSLCVSEAPELKQRDVDTQQPICRRSEHDEAVHATTTMKQLHTRTDAGSQERHCHFHAGVEHCEEDGPAGNNPSASPCDRISRDFNVPLRLVSVVVMFLVSATGVASPIYMTKWLPSEDTRLMTFLRHFGTGVVISTALVHLFMHSIFMFQNPCLGEIGYEGTPAAIMMAGLFVSFIVEYGGHEFLHWQQDRIKERDERLDLVGSNQTTQMVNIAVMEAGILFHSILIGLTLVVAGDEYYLTLLVVVLFHQTFEGVALGSRIAALGRNVQPPAGSRGHHHNHTYQHHHTYHQDRHAYSPLAQADPSESAESTVKPDRTSQPISLTRKLLLASGYAFVTPLGMLIGISVLNQFNGNDPTTAIVIGSMDAFSAGILIWVGVVEMWAGDWMGDEMVTSSPQQKIVGLGGLMTGMALMSLLGKWA